MDKRKVDVAIVGAGTAGLYALSDIKRRGLSWVLIQGGIEGTTCARVGCMPSKLLLNVADHFYTLKHFSDWGLSHSANVCVEPEQIMTYIRKMRDSFVEGVKSRTTDRMNESQFIRGYARFTGPNQLTVDNHYQVDADKIILCTGSSPLVPDLWRTLGEAVLTTDTFFEQPSLPRSLAIVGLGAIGLEIGQALAQLGMRVKGYDLNTWIGGITDSEINSQAIDTFNEYFPIKLGAGVALTLTEAGITVESEGDSETFEKVLVATGRRPNLAGLDLAAAGVKLDKKGMPEIDNETMQIKGHSIFIAGDLSGDRAVMHEASEEGLIVGFNVAQTKSQAFRRKTPFGIVFTAPNIARIGKSCAEIDPENSLRVNFLMASASRARVKHATSGSISLYADKTTGVLLGAELFCVDAEHLAHQLCWAIEQRLTIQSLVKMPVYHPVVEEALMSALEQLARLLEPEASTAELKLSPLLTDDIDHSH